MRRFLVVFALLLIVGLLALIAQWDPAGYVRPRTWALAWETVLAGVVSLAVTTGLFWVLSAVRPIQEIVLPGRDEASLAESQVMEALTRQTPDPATLPAIAVLFGGLAIRGAARILSVAIIYSITLWTFAPLA